MENGLPLWRRLPVNERAGTHLDWAAHNIRVVDGPAYGSRRGNLTMHGHIDLRQRVYQGGGEYKNFVLHKEQLASLALMVWEQVLESPAEWIELIDHELNRCYRIRKSVALEHGHVYDAGIGPRWGVPLSLWDVSGGPVEPTRPAPSPGPSAPTVGQLGLL